MPLNIVELTIIMDSKLGMHPWSTNNVKSSVHVEVYTNYSLTSTVKTLRKNGNAIILFFFKHVYLSSTDLKQ